MEHGDDVTSVQANGSKTLEENADVVVRRAEKKQKLLIWKNVILISISFSVTFMAFQSLQNIQSSLNPIGGLGVASLSVSYSFTILTGIFLTSLIISSKGCKWTLVVSTFCYIGFAVANFYPTWLTLIPAAVIVGVAAGPLWAAKCTYLSASALQYSKITGEKKGPILTHFFGIFSMIYLSGTIIGNILMSVLLEPGGRSSANNHSIDVYKICGASDCPSRVEKSSNGTLDKVADQHSVIVLMGIFAGGIFLSGVFIIIFVDNLKTEKDGKRILIKSQVSAVCRMAFKDKRMLALLPIQIYAGLLPGFVAVDFSKSFVTCSLGIKSLGFVLIGFASGQAAFSVVIGKIERLTGRRIIMFSFYIVSVGLFVFLLKWDAKDSPSYVFYIVAGIFGVVKCVWRTETNSFSGVLFPDDLETAFAIVRTCTSIGFLISFAWGYYVCVYVKIYAHIIYLTLAILCYFITEYLERRRKRSEKIEMETRNEDQKL